MKRVVGIALLAIAATPLASASAWANWSLRSLTNNYGQIVSISLPFAPGESRQSDKYLVRGNMAVVVPGQGAIIFTDKGHNTPCSRPYWGVLIEYLDKKWGFYYDGEGTVDLKVNADGSIALTPGPAGQIVPGGGPPKCS